MLVSFSGNYGCYHPVPECLWNKKIISLMVPANVLCHFGPITGPFHCIYGANVLNIFPITYSLPKRERGFVFMRLDSFLVHLSGNWILTCKQGEVGYCESDLLHCFKTKIEIYIGTVVNGFMATRLLYSFVYYSYAYSVLLRPMAKTIHYSSPSLFSHPGE